MIMIKLRVQERSFFIAQLIIVKNIKDINNVVVRCLNRFYR